jgi:hypothetical protein
VSVVGFKVLIFKVVMNVTDGGDIGSGVVVFDVIGGQAGLAVADYDIAISDVEISLAALRAAGG